MARTLYS
ncbi:hypothetical protein YPPY94_4674, partial [Yersinia pestis PY-94]